MSTAVAVATPDDDGPFRIEGDLIYTNHVINAEDAFERLIETSGMGAFIGPSGSGKTHVLTRLANRHQDLKVVWIEPPFDPTQREFASLITKGLAPSVRLRTKADHLNFLLEEFASLAIDGKVMLVIDEAQRLGRNCVEDVRYLHDRVGFGFALALVGGAQCWKLVENDEMLRSRVRRVCDFAYLKDAEAIRMARSYSPIYKGVSNKLLIEINQACQGRFRTWFLFTDEAQGICRDFGKKRLTRDLVKDTLRLLNGRSKHGNTSRPTGRRKKTETSR